MTTYDVVILSSAKAALDRIELRLASRDGNPVAARAYTKRARDWCAQTLDFGYHRGEHRDDIMPGLRTQKAGDTNIIAAWVVHDPMQTVVVTDFYHGRPPNTPMDADDWFDDEE